MNKITSFDFDATNVRTLEQDGDQWFILRDVLDVMGSGTPPEEARAAIEGGLGEGYTSSTLVSDRLGRKQSMTVISEPGVTYLVATSRSEQGKRLNRYIHAELLPTLRKQGHVALSGSRLDSQLQNRTVGYVTLMGSLKRTATFTDGEQRALVAFDRTMREAGLPAQWEGVAPDPEVYRLTPAAARVVVEAYGLGKPIDKVHAALARIPAAA